MKSDGSYAYLLGGRKLFWGHEAICITSVKSFFLEGSAFRACTLQRCCVYPSTTWRYLSKDWLRLSHSATAKNIFRKLLSLCLGTSCTSSGLPSPKNGGRIDETLKLVLLFNRNCVLRGDFSWIFALYTSTVGKKYFHYNLVSMERKHRVKSDFFKCLNGASPSRKFSNKASVIN